MIVVTGANGKLGRNVVEELLKRVPAGDIGVSVRDVNTVQDLKERGVRVRQGNFDDSESLLHAFEGASQVLMISSHSLGKLLFVSIIPQSTRQRKLALVDCCILAKCFHLQRRIFLPWTFMLLQKRC